MILYCGEWTEVISCSTCGHTRIWHHGGVCGECGNKMCTSWMLVNQRVGRRVSDSVWWNPFTWADVSWEFKD